MTAGPQIEPVALLTGDGLTLEAEAAPAAQPRATAVVCHPHPLYGGSMHNNVVDRLFAHLPTVGVTTLRFNFRGSGRSEGRHGQGRDERTDVVAAIDELAGRHPDLPLVLAGYSFGADVGLSVVDERVGGWLAVAPPLRVLDPAEMGAGPDPRPKLIVTGSADDFRPPDQLAPLVAGWSNCELRVAEGASHFFPVGLDAVIAAADELLERLAPA